MPPADALIAARIAAVESVAQVPLVTDGWETLGPDVLDAYLDAVSGLVRPDAPRAVRVVHTSLHGVGNDTVIEAFARAGFPPLYAVASQSQPDPEFPTVVFPNPEEAGAIDAALELAREVGPDPVSYTHLRAHETVLDLVCRRQPVPAGPRVPDGRVPQPRGGRGDRRCVGLGAQGRA